MLKRLLPVRGWPCRIVILFLAVQLNAGAAEAPPADDALAANTLYESGNIVGALPYYERLAQKEPRNALYAERYAFTLVTQVNALPPGEKRKELIARIRAEAERAKSLGNNSNLLNTLLGSLDAMAAAPSPEVQELAAAEAAFQKGDYDKALAEYEAVAARNPRSYIARLYAGDMYYRKGNLDAAAKWFQDAIALNPDIETAHRYWGDALAKAKREDEALGHYIDAFVADPYGRTARVGIAQWAERTGVKLVKPNVPVPPAPTVVPQEGGNPKVTINLGPETLKNPRTGAAWLVYATVRSKWMTTEFAKRFPQEPKYRHSLAEEVEALRAALAVLKVDQLDLAGADWEVRDLLKLAQADMIEAYILLQAPDQGIAQDYVAYRTANRDKLAAYFRQFVIPPQ